LSVCLGGVTLPATHVIVGFAAEWAIRRSGQSTGRRRLGTVCGRYTARTTDAAGLASRFGFDARDAGALRDGLGRADVCPTEQVAAVVSGAGGVHRAQLLRWGLAPSWATLRGGRPLINARDDKLRTSGAWRGLASSAAHRCLVLADGWLDWQRPEDRRQPRQRFLHTLPGGAPFAMAGLWCVARPKDGDAPVASCTIVTVAANREASRLHDRMPAVLAGGDAEAAWLHPDVDLDGALELVAAVPDGVLEVAPLAPPTATAQTGDLQLVMPV
jgi:putative SOS response-associated peptidase YedK